MVIKMHELACMDIYVNLNFKLDKSLWNLGIYPKNIDGSMVYD